MKSLLISIISALGALVAASTSAGCTVIFFDEPKMPNSLISK